jgi:hypothetical protein
VDWKDMFTAFELGNNRIFDNDVDAIAAIKAYSLVLDG